MERRAIDFHSAEEVIRDIEALRQSGYQQTGKWNLTQICQHLAATMNGGMDGFGFRLPWILRATLLRWAFNYALKTRKLGSGFPTFKSLKPSHTDPSDDDDAIDACIESCRRAGSFAGPMNDYPLLNEVSVEQWQDFMWIHASHHLSFLVPK
ncbi:MAG: DUF1569 domain-containing protein [Planctomycetota bacterium]